jgi:hypothetical protein
MRFLQLPSFHKIFLETFPIPGWVVRRTVHFALEHKKIYNRIKTIMPVLVAARSKTLVCGRSLAGIVGSNHTGGMDVCLL